VLLELHGAATAESGPIDMRLLADVRALAGPAATVAITLDLHANLPPAVTELVDVVVGLHEYPHVDMAERAARAARIALRRARGELHVVSAYEKLPLLLPASTTDAAPGALIKEYAQRIEARPNVLACSIFHGFPYADVPDAGSAVAVLGTGSPATLRDHAREVAAWLWSERAAFIPEHLTAEEAVAAARAAAAPEAQDGMRRPVVISDFADNPGGGAPSDATFVARALLNAVRAGGAWAGARAAVGALYDPETVRRASEVGVGGSASFAVGGRHGWASGEPLEVEARVAALTDGHVICTSMRKGHALEFGPCARLDVSSLSIVVCSRRAQVFDPAIFLLHGIDPAACDVVAVKSSHHFRSGFAHLAPVIVTADATGLMSSRLESFPPRANAAFWPLDPAVGYPR
jgi:microcystin degradation protein MlrC